MDVKTAFLNGRLNKNVYMVKPEGFENPKHPRRVCKLQRSIYVLKQASMSWNKRFDEEIKKYGFTQNLDDPCVYKRASGSIIVFLILYVDDILLMGNNIPMLQDVKSWLGIYFAMKDLDLSKSQGPSTPAEVKRMKGISYALAVGSIIIDKPMDMYCDNTCAITIADEPGVQKDNNLADPFTKPMPYTKHVEQARSIGLRLAGSFM
ncbi:retrotransposon protein, putative, ty1-copia subclass [Tanacetum coccineum]